MTRDNLEKTVGGVVVICLALVLASSYGGQPLKADGAYDLKAGFNRIDGIAIGDEVRLGGIKVGTVAGQALDDQFRAMLTFRLDAGLALPSDSSAAIHTDGLFGAKFIILDPGGEEETLENGDEIQFTQDSVIVEDLLELIIAEGKANRAKTKETKP